MLIWYIYMLKNNRILDYLYYTYAEVLNLSFDK